MKQTTANMLDTSRWLEDTEAEYWAQFLQLQGRQSPCKLSFGQYLLNLSGKQQSQYSGT